MVARGREETKTEEEAEAVQEEESYHSKRSHTGDGPPSSRPLGPAKPVRAVVAIARRTRGHPLRALPRSQRRRSPTLLPTPLCGNSASHCPPLFARSTHESASSALSSASSSETNLHKTRISLHQSRNLRSSHESTLPSQGRSGLRPSTQLRARTHEISRAFPHRTGSGCASSGWSKKRRGYVRWAG